MENTYNEGLCYEKHNNLNQRLDKVDKRLDEHDDRIQDMEKANIKLTEILERVTNPKKVNFWDTKGGQLIPWLIFSAVILVVMALVGTNILDAYKAIQGSIPVVK